MSNDVRALCRYNAFPNWDTLWLFMIRSLEEEDVPPQILTLIYTEWSLLIALYRSRQTPKVSTGTRMSTTILSTMLIRLVIMLRTVEKEVVILA